MIRVHVICEGQTEEMFVNELLRLPFARQNIDLRPSLIGKPGHKGGDFKYDRLLHDLKARLLYDKDCFCTTFFDFYALPKTFPGKEEAQNFNGAKAKSDFLNSRLIIRLQEDIGDEPILRFIPYVQMYEFEGLLFSNPAGMANGIGYNEITEPLQRIRDTFPSPEEINDSPVTAPSKRILKLFPGYDKVICGSLSAIEIGLDVIRSECRLFNDWLHRLEQIPKSIKISG